MAMSGGDAGWYHALEDFNLLLCSSSSSSRAIGRPGLSRAEDILPIACAPPGPGHRSCKNELLEEQASSDGVFAAADCLSSALMNLQREDDGFYMPMPLYSAPPPTVGDQYCSDQLPPLPPLLPLTALSDIDLEAFDNNNADEQKKPPLDDPMIMIPALAVHNPTAVAGTRTPIPIHGTTTTVGQNAGAIVVHSHQKMAMAIEEDSSGFRRGASSGGVEMAVVRHHDEHRRCQAAGGSAVEVPMLLPPPRARGTGGSGGGRSAAPAAGKTRLDHIGFEELRKYFYMPITRAAREMNVGLTVLKKRCRELGVARWPHRKMKSLKSLMANVQEMGKGMSPVALQQEIAALETYCALMEENPWIELTDRTKKLRQACFKESYKRRRAAAVSVLEMDHIYSFAQQQQHHHQLLSPAASSSAADRHGQSNRFFGY